MLVADGLVPRKVGSKWELHCPLHREKTPSFTLYADHGFKCFGCGAAGDVFTYIMARDGVDFSSAKRLLAERAGIDLGAPVPADQQGPGATPPRVDSPALTLPADAHQPAVAECETIAQSRRINPEAVSLAARWGTMAVGTVCGQASWILTDTSRRVAEARRMDGKPYPAHGDLRERKAHTLRGSVKSWPCGLALDGGIPEGTNALLLVEGGPDFLAALHFFLERESFDFWPVAMLGAGAKEIHPEAIPLLSGRRVRLYPHDDPSGENASRRWAAQLQEAGCTVDAFCCAGIPRRDGRPCKDLNDLVLAAPEAHAELEDLLP